MDPNMAFELDAVDRTLAEMFGPDEAVNYQGLQTRNETLQMEVEPVPNSVERDIAEMFGPDEAVNYVRSLQTPNETLAMEVETFEGRRRTGSFTSDGTLGESDTSDSERSSSSSASVSEDEFSEANDSGANNTEWSEQPRPSRNLEFNATPGIKIPGASTMSPLEYFKIFYNNDFLETVARATNAHALDVISRTVISPESRLKRWRETTAQELLIFLGILFFMGSVRLNKISDYWKKTRLVTFHLNKYMSRNRFQIILRMLYFNTQTAGNTAYSQIEPLIAYFNDTMKKTIYPETNLTIDESMVLFRGRLSIRQYIKNKRHKFGIKLYVLADPNGLVHRLHMYKGSADNEVGGRGHVQKVVLKLLNDHLNAGHHVYMDNFYNSVELAEILISKNTNVTGTLLSNRKKNPKVVTSKKLKRGESIHRSNRKGVCVMKWKDKRDVLTISTEHTPQMVEVLNRRGRAVSKPKMVVEYNKYMKGVDRHDQMLSYYPCEHKTLRWYKKIAIHILQSMFLNAYFMHNKGTSNTLTLETFRNKVLEGLLPPPAPQTIPPQKPTHMPSALPRNENNKIKRRKCWRCWNTQDKRKDTNLYCADCNKGLCLECYGPYHNENNLLA